MAADNSQKVHLGLSLNNFAQGKALEAIQQLGKALPCSVVAVSGSIVTVSFEVQSNFTLPQVTCPMFGPEYIRYPTQIGDLGVVFPADAYLGGISGLGGGTAGLTLPSNLSALVFFPIASKNWSATDDANAVVIYGPNGVVLRDTGKTSKIVVAPSVITTTTATVTTTATSGETHTTPTFTINGNLVINGTISQGSSGSGTSASLIGPLVVTNNVTAGGIDLETHKHTGVTTGGGTTGGPTG